MKMLFFFLFHSAAAMQANAMNMNINPQINMANMNMAAMAMQQQRMGAGLMSPGPTTPTQVGSRKLFSYRTNIVFIVNLQHFQFKKKKKSLHLIYVTFKSPFSHNETDK